ncbi:EAL domain-containing protein [Neptunomonas antarctica]|uniref:Diguanylate cyclase (GGDEF) domain-containing protein n=1 Tax=Neptunomonas antarctica TaxID=619304 RepID=A0A1N7IXD0_9GAMM|nr:EAL domain-containing protein [Neptunomonas antarctica]SIS41714.1 diguanylate cyclase (GGDEF) domain-containing protein [Neptunomonas antarctica]
MKKDFLPIFRNDDGRMSIFLAIISVMIAIIPMTVLYFAVNNQAKITLADTLSQDLEEKSFLIKNNVERFYRQRMIDLKNLSQADVLETDNFSAITQYIQEITENSPYFVDVEIASLNGFILANSSESSDQGLSIYEHYAHLKDLIDEAFSSEQGKVIISPLTQLDSGNLGVVLMTPVTNDSNTEVIKLLLVEASLEPIKALLKELDDTEPKFRNSISLINSHGLVMASNDDSILQQQILPELSFDQKLMIKAKSGNRKVGHFRFLDGNHEQVILGFADLAHESISPNLNWTVVITAPYEKILAPAEKLATKLSLAAIAVAIIIFSLMYFASRKIMDAIWQKANFDPITKLPNRRLFSDRLAQSLQLSKRTGHSSVLIYIDLDRFKEVNDSLGHDAGDQLLIETADRIALLLHESDSISRVGGDEFSVILNEVIEPIKIDRMAESIITSLNNPFYIKGNAVFISASIGIAIYPTNGTDISTLLKSADQALYHSKNRGRNRYSFFTNEMQQLSDRRHRISNDLRIAISNGEFEVFYQPITSMAPTARFKAEALIRWHHPELGPVSPVEFIPIAEETNFISELGDWVFHETLNTIQQIQAKHKLELNISINISPIQFKSKNLLTDWLEQLNKKGLSGKNITVEITEGVLLVNDPLINNQLLQFKNAGISISLDDFGTGYSSLAYLRKLTIDTLKIDKAFIDDIKQNSNELALCKAITVMSKTLDLEVIAEGVETEEQAALLSNLGINYCQGYFYSKPLPLKKFINYLLNHPK